MRTNFRVKNLIKDKWFLIRQSHFYVENKRQLLFTGNKAMAPFYSNGKLNIEGEFMLFIRRGHFTNYTLF